MMFESFRRTLVGLKFSRVDSLGARDWLFQTHPCGVEV